MATTLLSGMYIILGMMTLRHARADAPACTVFWSNSPVGPNQTVRANRNKNAHFCFFIFVFLFVLFCFVCLFVCLLIYLLLFV